MPKLHPGAGPHAAAGTTRDSRRGHVLARRRRGGYFRDSRRWGVQVAERNTGGIPIVATFEKRKARALLPGFGAGEAMDPRRAIVEEEPVASHYPNRCRRVDHHGAVRRNYKIDLTARPNEPNDAGLIGAVRGKGRPDISLLAGRHSEKEPHEDRGLNNRPGPPRWRRLDVSGKGYR
jgi:hypothetical protein